VEEEEEEEEEVLFKLEEEDLFKDEVDQDVVHHVHHTTFTPTVHHVQVVLCDIAYVSRELRSNL
jgi:hypothetical protein